MRRHVRKSLSKSRVSVRDGLCGRSGVSQDFTGAVVVSYATSKKGADMQSDTDIGERLHRILIAELSSAGCFRPATARSIAYGGFILAGYAAAYAALLSDPGALVRVLAIVTLAFFSVHAGFLAHEATHGALTRNRVTAEWVGQVFNTLLTSLCYSYFTHIHRLHHPHCNDRSRDPDMQSESFSMYLQSAEVKTGLGRLVSRL